MFLEGTVRWPQVGTEGGKPQRRLLGSHKAQGSMRSQPEKGEFAVRPGCQVPRGRLGVTRNASVLLLGARVARTGEQY